MKCEILTKHNNILVKFNLTHFNVNNYIFLSEHDYNINFQCHYNNVELCLYYDKYF